MMFMEIQITQEWKSKLENDTNTGRKKLLMTMCIKKQGQTKENIGFAHFAVKKHARLNINVNSKTDLENN